MEAIKAIDRSLRERRAERYSVFSLHGRWLILMRSVSPGHTTPHTNIPQQHIVYVIFITLRDSDRESAEDGVNRLDRNR